MIAGLALYLFSFNFTPGHTLSLFWIHLGLMVAIAGATRDKSAKKLN
jgi:hypothetical protein